MTEPETTPAPEVTVPTLSGYYNEAGSYLSFEEAGYGVRTILVTKSGIRFGASFDPPEAALEYARDLMAQAWRAIEMRDGPPQAFPPRPLRQEPSYLTSATVEERRSALDPKTCSGCGVVEGATFEPRHHPQNCPALLAWIEERDAEPDPPE